MDKQVETTDSIEVAIDECVEYIDAQRSSARQLLELLGFIGIAVIALLITFVFFIFNDQRNSRHELRAEVDRAITTAVKEIAKNGKILTPITISTPRESSSGTYNIIVFAILSAFTVVFCVLMAVYRFHLNEVSKTQHYKIGFIRIRIAADSGRKGYQSEVREALAHMAFTVPGRLSSAGRNAIESPVVGHPASEFSTTLLNRILESIEIKAADKGIPEVND